MDYLFIKSLHILSAILLFGTGLGSAFYKFMTDRSGNLAAMAVTNRHVVLADWLFTTPAIIVQPITGVWMAYLAGWPLDTPWLLLSIALYLLAGACWLPVVWLQIRMRDDSAQAIASATPLAARYRRDARHWFWLGVPAFIAMVAVVILMVHKPL
ncbi:MAG TPA: DUF2269 domain-containing protein [Gammaproteobacteria bacterium]